LPATILAIICWLTSALILTLARPGQSQALHTGFIFTLAAIVIISLQASLDGTPLAWLGGHVLIFPLAVSWAYLGLLPRSTPFSPRQRNLYRLTLGLSVALAIVAGIEALFLFPAGASWYAISGLSFYHLGLLLSAAGIILMTFFLLKRLFNLPTNSYLRQQIKILLFFIITATIPIAILTLLPHALTGQPWLPFPISISLLGLAPTGYLYVIHRRGLLGLDRFFSRALTLIWLSLLMVGGFALGLWLARDYLATADGDSIAVVTILFFPALMTTMYLHAPIHRTVQRTLYGSTLDQQKLTLDQMAARLANKPEASTLFQVLQEVTQDLTVAQALFLQRVNDAYYQSVVQLGLPASTTGHFAASAIPYLSRPLLRPRQPRAAVWQDFPWAQLVLPLYARGEQTGLLLLGRPQPDGYFNARQMQIASRLATILAIAHENIALFEATRRMARQRLAVRQQERHQVARQIHDGPLQEITYVTTVIDQLALDHTKVAPTCHKMNDHLRSAAHALRQTCQGLYSPTYDQGLQMALEEICAYYRETHELTIETALSLTITEEHIPEAILVTFCSILTEALNNIVKHAQGANAHVTLEENESTLTLTVCDDGPGSQAPSLPFTELMRRGHLGIVGMHEWAQMVGGALQIAPRTTKGLKVILQCSLLQPSA
jgi:signal transduction histidine kinase